MIKLALLNLAETSAEPLFSAIEPLLSEEQITRYHNLHHDHRRREWAGGRWLANKLLTELANGAEFTLIAEGGKPAVESLNPLYVNWSHSGDWLFAAATTVGPIGCDIEQTNRSRDWLKLADRNFSASETQFLASLPDTELSAAFRRLWTLKEAFVKCSGEGISAGLKQPEFPRQVLAGEKNTCNVAGTSCHRDDWQGAPWAVSIAADVQPKDWPKPLLVKV